MDETIGNALDVALKEANLEIQLAMARRDALIEAWARRDVEWLAEAGYITRAMADEANAVDD
jgi:hypothetical protein